MGVSENEGCRINKKQKGGEGGRDCSALGYSLVVQHLLSMQVSLSATKLI